MNAIDGIISYFIKMIAELDHIFKFLIKSKFFNAYFRNIL